MRSSVNGITEQALQRIRNLSPTPQYKAYLVQWRIDTDSSRAVLDVFRNELGAIGDSRARRQEVLPVVVAYLVSSQSL